MQTHAISFQTAISYPFKAFRQVLTNPRLLISGLIFWFLMLVSLQMFAFLGFIWLPILGFGLYNIIEQVLQGGKPPLKTLFIGFMKSERIFTNGTTIYKEEASRQSMWNLLLLGSTLSLLSTLAVFCALQMVDVETIKEILAPLKSMPASEVPEYIKKHKLDDLKTVIMLFFYIFLGHIAIIPFFIYSNLFVGWHGFTQWKSMITSFAIFINNFGNFAAIFAIFVVLGLVLNQINWMLITFVVTPVLGSAALLVSGVLFMWLQAFLFTIFAVVAIKIFHGALTPPQNPSPTEA